MWTYRSVPKIVFGEDALDDLETLDGQRAVVVSDRTLNRLGFVEKVEDKLNTAGLDTDVLLDIPNEPTLLSIENLVPELNDLRDFQWIVAVGGGSVIDAAKALWIRYENPNLLLEEIVPFIDIVTRKKAHFVAIPTTSGTGSEVSWAIVLGDDDNGRKLELASPAAIPDIAIVDPVFPVQMSPILTADTGVDALANSIEAFTSEWRNAFSDAFALQPIPDIFHYLPQAYNDGSNMIARTRMHIAATLSGLAFTNSQAGLAHSMAHALGAVFHLAHGRAVAISLPYAMEFNQRLSKEEGGSDAVERYSTIGRLIQESGETDSETASKLVLRLRSLLAQIKEPLCLKDAGIYENAFSNQLDRLVTLASESTCTFVNPRTVSTVEFEKLFLCAFEGSSITF